MTSEREMGKGCETEVRNNELGSSTDAKVSQLREELTASGLSQQDIPGNYGLDESQGCQIIVLEDW